MGRVNDCFVKQTSKQTANIELFAKRNLVCAVFILLVVMNKHSSW